MIYSFSLRLLFDFPPENKIEIFTDSSRFLIVIDHIRSQTSLLEMQLYARKVECKQVDEMHEIDIHEINSD